MLPDCCCCCLQLKKQRDERKESMLNSDPAALQKEISRLEHQAEFRAEAGANAKRQRKIDELHEVKKEAERRRADQASEFGPPLEQQAAMVQTYTSTGSLDLSAITGQKRKAAAPAQQAASPSSRQPDGPADVSASARAAPAQVPAAQQAAELAAARAAAVFGGVSSTHAEPPAPAYGTNAEIIAAAEAAAATAAAAAAPPASAPLPEGWKQAKHPDGRTYYYVKGTKTVQWKRPTEPAPSAVAGAAASDGAVTETAPADAPATDAPADAPADADADAPAGAGDSAAEDLPPGVAVPPPAGARLPPGPPPGPPTGPPPDQYARRSSPHCAWLSPYATSRPSRTTWISRQSSPKSAS